MPTTRGGALRQQQGEDDSNVAMTDDVFSDSNAGESARADEAASPGARQSPTQHPASQLPSERFLSTLIESITRVQAEANRSLINSILASTSEFRASTPAEASLTHTSCGGAAAPGVVGTMSTGANFAKCTARFDGSSQDAETLEAFLDAVQIYKECAAVTDEHALRGLPMLLEGEAAVWWRGVKASVTSWLDAITRLRATFGVAQPAYKVFRHIFSAEQGDNERADTFLCKVRALFSKLPYNLDESVQLDMCYGLLHRRIKKRVPRDSVCSLDELLYKSRIAEETIKDNKVTSDNFNSRKSNTTPLAKVITTPTTDRNLTRSSFTTSDGNTIKKNRTRCNYCRLFGHVSDECRNRDKVSSSDGGGAQGRGLRCYGCGKQGVIRSKCDICVGSKKEEKPSFNSIECDYNKVDNASCVYIKQINTHESYPLVNISVRGHCGVAIVDTGATHSIASPSLYQLLVGSGVQFEEVKRYVRLADGSQGWKHLLTTDINISIKGRNIKCPLLVLPGSDTRTLLGVDFLLRAGMVLDIARGKWTFSDSPQQSFDFVYTYTLGSPDTDIPRTETTEATFCANDFSLADSTLQVVEGDPELTLKPHDVRNNALTLRRDEGLKLTPDQRDEFNQFITSRTTRFARAGPATEFAMHRIKVSPVQEPIACSPYRMPQSKKDALQKELDNLLQDDFVEECESPWAANVVLVAKKDGGTRLCVDYRKLNAVTEPDRYPLPRMDDVLHAAKTSNFMSTLDLRSGYFQVCVAEEDRDKTAFVTPVGTYRFKRMPMGLRNSGATFQRLMDRFRSNLRDVSVLCYLDDLIVLSDTFDKHLKDLEVVFDRLELFNLRVNREKSVFARDSVKFLGHLIVPGGIQVDPDKTAAIYDMSVPKNLTHLKCFLQTSSWFRRFIPKYAEIARPLTSLLKKNSTWHWSADQQSAFNTIKQLLVSAPILRQADETLPFTLRTDSSGYCLGAVLMQGEGPDERPIEYASRLLNQAERNYTTTEREALAVVWAVTKFRGYIEGAETVVKSDHQPLKWLMNVKSPSGRLTRWALTLQSYNLRIEYTPGKVNVIADTLSRPACEDEVACDLCQAVIDVPSRDARGYREAQMLDPDVRKIIEDLETVDEPFRGRPWADRGYIISDGVLYRYGPESNEDDNACLVVPSSERRQVLADYHDAPTAGHLGMERTLQRISTKYYWPGMRAFVADYIKSCVPCQRYKVDTRRPAGLLQSPALTQRFEVIAVDLFGPLPESKAGNKWILIIEDVCSRWVELFPLKSATSMDCAELLMNEVFLRYGVPRRMISDNGVQFISEIMQQVCFVFGIDQSLTPFYHPEANPVERKNRDLKPQLSIHVGQDHSTWDVHLAAVRFSMNSAVTLSTGYSPAMLTFGRELRAPADVVSDMRVIVDGDRFLASVTPYLRRLSTVLLDARDTHERSQETQKKYADEHRRPAPDYEAGDLVLLKTQGANDAGRGQTPKFIPRRDGPYRIREALSSSTYRLERVSGEILGKYHVSQLTPFVGQVQPPLQEKRRRGRPRKE